MSPPQPSPHPSPRPTAPTEYIRYSALFADEDPDVDLGEQRLPTSRRDGVSITESGHVKLRQKAAARGGGRDVAGGTGGGTGSRPGQSNDNGGRGDMWARGTGFEGEENDGGEEEEEEEQEEEEEGGGGGGFRSGRRSPGSGRMKVGAH